MAKCRNDAEAKKKKKCRKSRKRMQNKNSNANTNRRKNTQNPKMTTSEKSSLTHSLNNIYIDVRVQTKKAAV